MILPSLSLDSTGLLARYFLPHQLNWIEAEGPLHAQGRPVFALAEKSVRIGWTYADAFKNVRKRLRFKKRDYLFATKDYPSALEYMQLCYNFAGLFDFTRTVLSHGEDYLKIPRLDPDGQPTGFTDEIKVGLIKFDNGSRIIAFSSNPRAMSVYAGDVGLDEFAKHPNARLLWETAQARVTWNYDLAVWSSHDGEDTLFNQFVQQARSSCTSSSPPFSEPLSPPLSSPLSQPLSPPLSSPLSPSPISNLPSPISTLTETHGNPRKANPDSQPSTNNSQLPASPWNLYYRVTIADAIELGLLNLINRVQGTHLDRDQFLANCRARAGSEEIFQQSYMCNPMGAASANIVEWSAIERCRADYEIQRIHLEADAVLRHFGQFDASTQEARQRRIHNFLRSSFHSLFSPAKRRDDSQPSTPNPQLRLGFDVAASGQGDLAVVYIDEIRASELWLRALLTCRTEDWHFLKTALFFLLEEIPTLVAAGDESGLGRQICWEAAEQFHSRFINVNFATKKSDLGFAIMNQLSVAEKRFPRSAPDIAADYFALRKIHTGTRWIFSEGRNTLNAASHCDIAWAGALATHAHTERRFTGVGACVLCGNGWIDENGYHPFSAETEARVEREMLSSDDPAIWRRLC